MVSGLLAALPGMGSIVLLIGLLYYVFAVMANKLYGEDFPDLFGSLGSSLFTLFTVMTLEGWTNDVARPVMQNHPYAWVFFVVYIVITTFMVLNLFIGVVVNAMQEEASKADAEERGRSLRISYTLPAEPTGLTPPAEALRMHPYNCGGGLEPVDGLVNRLRDYAYPLSQAAWAGYSLSA